MVPINHVGPTLAQRNIWKRMVDITLAYAGLVGLRALDQHRTNGWQLSWPDEQNVIGLTPFVDVGPTKLPTKCQCWPNKCCPLHATMSTIYDSLLISQFKRLPLCGPQAPFPFTSSIIPFEYINYYTATPNKYLKQKTFACNTWERERERERERDMKERERDERDERERETRF